MAAAVGGGEFLAIIFGWIMRRLSIEPEVQELSRSENAALTGGAIYGPKTEAAVSEAMRQCPYSAAIGPPRKLHGPLSLEPSEALPQGTTPHPAPP